MIASDKFWFHKIQWFEEMDINHINPPKVKDLLDAQEIVLLDVRTPEEFNHVHIPGCKHIPLRLLQAKWNTLPKDKPIVVYCHRGGRGTEACAFLKAQGILNVQNLEGGIDAWAEEVEPTLDRY